MQAVLVTAEKQSTISELSYPETSTHVIRSIGLCDVLRYICSFQSGRRGADWKREDGDLCAESGHTSLVFMMEKLGRPMEFTSRAAESAACAGNLPLIQHLFTSRNFHPYTLSAFNCAAVSGHLEICQWMHSELKSEASEWAMDGASRNGHEHVVRWLHFNRSEGCTVRAYNNASLNGHLNIVKFLHVNRSEGGTAWALQGAAINGYLDVIKFHMSNCVWASAAAADAVNLAAINGRLNVVQYFYEEVGVQCTNWGLQGAREMGFNSIVKYILAHGYIDNLIDDDSSYDSTESED